MYRVGIDVGSTYTKYCVMNSENKIISLFSEKSPVKQREYFTKKIDIINKEFNNPDIVSCGYGKKNILALKRINELTALARGIDYIYPDEFVALDIGGQDTKIIRQYKGQLKEFFLNDKCAAGSGMFLNNTCNALGKGLDNIKLLPIDKISITLSSVCAVFAQSEIVEHIAANVSEDTIISAVVKHILAQAKVLLLKCPADSIVLSGGMSEILGIKEYAEKILDVECMVGENNSYLSAIGCAIEL